MDVRILGTSLHSLSLPLFPSALPPTLTNSKRMNSQCELYEVSRDTLFSYHPASEAFLQRMMALYVASHYKNQPNDLQLMSDAPAHGLFVLLPPFEGMFLFLVFLFSCSFFVSPVLYINPHSSYPFGLFRCLSPLPSIPRFVPTDFVSSYGKQRC